MARAPKRLRKSCSVTLFPRFLRFFCLGRSSLGFYVRRGVLESPNRTIAESTLNSYTDEESASVVEEAPDVEEAADTELQKPFVAPTLDRSRLIIEELKMGFWRNQHLKAEVGSKVSVRCEYKSEGGKLLEMVNHDLELGRSREIMDLQEGIYGMSVGDKRRLHIPPSLQSDGRAICEVTLTNVHKLDEFDT